MQEPMKFFNFQLPYRTFEELTNISKRKDCSVAAVVRTGVDRIITEYHKETVGEKAHRGGCNNR